MCLTGCTTLAASFLLVGALIVITCASLCLTLPGVNALHDVILPAILPGTCAILISIPFIISSVKSSREKHTLREGMLDRMITVLEDHDVPSMKRKQRTQFILTHFLQWHEDESAPGELLKNTSWTMEYQKKVLTDLQAKIGTDKKTRNPRQEKITTAITRATAKLTERKKK